MPEQTVLGELYQLDMEMAFANQEDVFAVLEDVLPPIFSKYGIYQEASKTAIQENSVSGSHG